MDKNIIINIKKKQINFNRNDLETSFENDKINNIPKIMPEMKFINGVETNNSIDMKNKFVNSVMSDGKIKPTLSKYNNKSSYPSLLRNNKNKIGLDENDNYFNTFTKRDNTSLSPLSQSNYIKHKNNSKYLVRNYSMNSYINNTLKNLQTNVDHSIVTNSNNVLLVDNNKSTQVDRLNPKNAIRINKIKDDYINFLQKQYEDKNKINFNLDLNNKELLQKCNDLIQDNILLNKELYERTNKLNKSIQDNKYMKAKLDKSLLNVEKNEQKIGYYEEQLKLFQSNNDNYQKIIQDLKEQNYQLNMNIIQIKSANEEEIKKMEEEQKKMEEEYNNKIEDIKKNLGEEYNMKIEALNKDENKINDLMEEIKILKEKNNELQEELKKKDNIIELMYKDNEKLVNENNLKNMQIEQNTRQINDLNQILQHKENLINSFKENEQEKENEKIFLNKSNSRGSFKIENNSDYISENLTKLINDNEENKVKLEYLNDKIKNINKIEQKYNQLINKNKAKSISTKSSYILRNTNTALSPKNMFLTGNNPIYISKNNTKKNNKPNMKSNSQNNSIKNIIKKNDFQEIRLNYNKNNNYIDVNKNINLKLNKNTNNKNIINYVRKPILVNSSLPLTTSININIDNDTKNNSIKRNDTNERVISEYKDFIEKKNALPGHKNRAINVNKSNSININKKSRIFEIDIKKNYKDKKDKSSDKINLTKNIYKNDDNVNPYLDIQKILQGIEIEKEKRSVQGKQLEEEKNEIKKKFPKMERLNNLTYKPNITTNFSLDNNKNNQDINVTNKEIENIITINKNLNLNKNKDININKDINKIIINTNKNKNKLSYYLFGIDRNDCLHIFDINNKKWVGKKKIFELRLDDKSNSFKKDYQYEGTLLYNMLEGVYILTGEKTDTLYYYNIKTNTISKICKFNNSHDNGSIMYDKNSKCLYVFGGKKTTSCEYYSLKDKKIYALPDLICDRANASFIISNNKIFGFFGFSYNNETYAKTIEYIDYIKKDKWVELKNIIYLNDNILFDIESVSTMYYKQNKNKILIYSGIQGEDEEFITEYYLLYDSKSNTMDKINKWELNQYKHVGNFWKEYSLKNNDPKGFHFAKNSRFISLPKKFICDGYNENDLIDILIDYKNNVHFILQEKEKIDIYRGEI